MKERVAHSTQSGDTRCIVGTPTVATKYFGNARIPRSGASYLTEIVTGSLHIQLNVVCVCRTTARVKYPRPGSDDIARRTGRRQLQCYRSTRVFVARFTGRVTHVRFHLMTPFAA
jgi:hypothetical protein